MGVAASATLMVFAPLFGTDGVELAGAGTVDAYGTWWFHWWVALALDTGASLTRTDLLFFPWGKDVLTHTGGNLLDAALVAPIRAIAGPAAAWNVLAAGAVFTNGLAGALWGAGRGRSAVALGAAVAALHPFPLHEIAMGRPTQAILAPLLLALWLGDRAFREGRHRDAAGAGAALALQGWIYWYAAGFGALALAALALGRPWGRRLGGLAIAGGVAVALTAPAVLPLAGALRSGGVPGLLPIDAWLAGDAAFRNVQDGTVQLGVLGPWGAAGFQGSGGFAPEGLALGLVGLVATALAPWRWRAVAALGLVLALGPFPGGVFNPLYVGLAAAVPPMERLYWPVRALCVLVPAAIVGLVTLAGRLPPRGRAALAVATFAGLVVEARIGGVLPLATWTPSVPPVATCLAAAEGAVVVLPYGLDQEPLVWQTVHGRPMLNGMHERSPSLVPAGQRALREENGWLRATLTATSDPREEVPWTDAEKEAVRALGYRFLVLRVDALVEPGGRVDGRGRQRAALRKLASLAGDPVYEADGIVVFAPWGGWPGGCGA